MGAFVHDDVLRYFIFDEVCIVIIISIVNRISSNLYVNSFFTLRKINSPWFHNRVLMKKQKTPILISSDVAEVTITQWSYLIWKFLKSKSFWFVKNSLSSNRNKENKGFKPFFFIINQYFFWLINTLNTNSKSKWLYI